MSLGYAYPMQTNLMQMGAAGMNRSNGTSPYGVGAFSGSVGGYALPTYSLSSNPYAASSLSSMYQPTHNFTNFSTESQSLQGAQGELQAMASQLMAMTSQLDPDSPEAQQMTAQLQAISAQSAQLSAQQGVVASPFGMTNPSSLGFGVAAGGVGRAAAMATAKGLPQKYQGTELGRTHTELTTKAMTGQLGPRMGWLLNFMNSMGKTDSKKEAAESNSHRVEKMTTLHDELSTKLSTVDPHSVEGQELIDRLVGIEKDLLAEYDSASDKQIENLVDSLKILLDTLEEGTPKFLAIKQRVTNLQKIRHTKGGLSATGNRASSDSGTSLLNSQLKTVRQSYMK